MNDYLIMPDFEPAHQKYSNRLLRMLGHRIETWKIEARQIVSAQYAGYNHVGSCERCHEVFRITVFAMGCDLFAWDGLVVTYGQHHQESDTRFAYRVEMLRKHRGNLICKWIRSML